MDLGKTYLAGGHERAMKKCKIHGRFDEACQRCEENLKAEQSVMIDRLMNRLEEIYTAHPELRKELSELELKYPLTAIEILEHVPFSDDVLSFSKLMDRFRLGLKIGANDAGFFIYRNMVNVQTT